MSWSESAKQAPMFRIWASLFISILHAKPLNFVFPSSYICTRVDKKLISSKHFSYPTTQVDFEVYVYSFIRDFIVVSSFVLLQH